MVIKSVWLKKQRRVCWNAFNIWRESVQKGWQKRICMSRLEGTRTETKLEMEEWSGVMWYFGYNALSMGQTKVYLEVECTIKGLFRGIWNGQDKPWSNMWDSAVSGSLCYNLFTVPFLFQGTKKAIFFISIKGCKKRQEKPLFFLELRVRSHSYWRDTQWAYNLYLLTTKSHENSWCDPVGPVRSLPPHEYVLLTFTYTTHLYFTLYPSGGGKYCVLIDAKSTLLLTSVALKGILHFTACKWGHSTFIYS